MPGRYAIALAATLVVLLTAPPSPAAPTPGTLLAVPLSAAAPTSGTDIPPVVPQTSIRAIQLGMGPERVLELMGRKPDTTKTQAHPIVERTKTVSWGGLRVVYDGVKPGARVISISTTSRRDRTVRGVGVGSAEETVRQRVSGVSCRTEYGYRRCSIGKPLAGNAVTDFAISRKGRVMRISLSRVLD